MIALTLGETEGPWRAWNRPVTESNLYFKRITDMEDREASVDAGKLVQETIAVTLGETR